MSARPTVVRVVDLKRGALELPEGVKTIYSEPGLLAKLNRPTKFFAKPPEHHENYYWPAQPNSDGSNTDSDNSSNSDDDNSSNEARVQEHNVFSTYASYFQRTATLEKEELLIIGELNTEQEIIVSDIPLNVEAAPGPRKMHSKYAQAVTFKRETNKRNDMPESGNEIKVLAGGFVDQHNVTMLEIFRRFRSDIFPNPPSTRDIRQGNLADCFLLSAVISLLNTDEGINYIQGMMKQLKHTTVVRFYHPKTLKPVYIEVENSIYHRLGSNAVRHQAPWVHILEKAYAGFARKLENEKVTLATHTFLDMYGKGGNTELALKILTGKETKSARTQLQEGAFVPWSFGLTMMTVFDAYNDPESEQYLDANWLRKKVSAHMHEFRTDDSVLKAFGSVENVITWCQYIYDMCQRPDRSEAIQKEGAELKMILLNAFSLKHTPTLREVALLIGQINNFQDVPFDVTSAWGMYVSSSKKYLANEDAPTMLRFKNADEYGEYSAHDIKIYNDIAQGLEHNYMTASSLSSFGLDENKKPNKVPGLRAQHAYAISNVFEKHIDDRTIKFIRVYNPWGNTGRRYIFKGMQYRDNGVLKTAEKDFSVEDRNVGHFDVELSDFIKYFKRYTSCPRFENVGMPEELIEQHSDSADDDAWLMIEHPKNEVKFNSEAFLSPLLGTIIVKLSRLDIDPQHISELIGNTQLIIKGQDEIDPALCIDMLTSISAMADAIKRQADGQGTENKAKIRHEMEVIGHMLDETINQLNEVAHSATVCAR